uniref:Uncharacterized protein n=1 Tax=Caenorhabditis tropicalis TaxID=1561998 RepID=A0A1I7TT22_9PELO
MKATDRTASPRFEGGYAPVPRPEQVQDRGCCSTIWSGCSKTYTPSVLTLLIYLLATTLVIIAMIFDDITIPRLLTGILAAIVYVTVVLSVYMDLARENHAPHDGNQDLLIAKVKKLMYTKVKFHAIITWLTTVMVMTTPIVDDDVLWLELLVTIASMGAVLIIGANVEPPRDNSRERV